MKRHCYMGLVALTLLLGACDQLSTVGDQQEPEPHAAASTLGWPYKVDTAELTTITVRSGGDVLLSGKNSQKGDDDTGVPLIRFDWQQLSGPKVDFVYRTASTIYFTTPQDQPDGTELRFKLTVYDAKGNYDSTEAVVVVRAVPDSDHFLHYLDVPTTVTVGLATTGPAPGANAAADTIVRVTMTKLVSFVDRNGVPHTDVRVALDPAAGNPAPRALEKSTLWTALHGGSASCADPINPSVEFPLPRLDLDDVLIDPIPGFPGAIVLGDVVEPSDIDQARARFRLDASAGGVVPALCVGGVQRPNGSTWNADDVVPVTVPWDSGDDAMAYYKTIDPGDTKVYFDQWLSQNGLNTSLPKWGADAHAIYTNDFDLGFGRDMYMKTGSCDTGFTKAMPVQQRLGKCDVAAVVVNYADLEAAAKRTSPIIAVAMEYSRVGTAGVRFTKFYIYSPDTGTGRWKRVGSVNLDGRGEQYVPSTCTVCHGGVPASQAVPVNGPYPGFAGSGGGGNGNVNASFLPWDLDALLFSDTDPGFTTRSREAELKKLYTGAAQMDELKALNLAAYSTWSDPTGQTGRFALARELLETWYGADLSSNGFNGVKGSCTNGACVPDSWKEGGTRQNPAGTATIYRQVFASNCRACHINQVPQTIAGSAGVGDPRGWAACNGTQQHTNVGHQIPMACYWQFANASALGQRLSNNEMPFARRTSDQLWETGGGGTDLLDHLRTVRPTLATAVPGVPLASLGTAAWDPTYPLYPDLGQFVDLDGTASTSARNHSWSVFACTGNQTVPGSCARRIPVIDAVGRKARFAIDDVVTYRVQLALNDGTATATGYVTALNRAPAINSANLPATLTFGIGASVTINQAGSRIFTAGNGPESGHRILVQSSNGSLQISPSACSTGTGCPGDTTITISTVPGAVTTATFFISALQFTVRDADPGATPSSIATSRSVNVTSTFTAPDGLSLGAVSARDTLTIPAVPAVLPLLTTARASLPTAIQSDVTLDFVSVANFNTQNLGTLSWTAGAADVSYLPKEMFSTQMMSGAVRPGSPTVSFTYRLRRTSTGETSTATAIIQVRATATFTQAANVWKSSTSCNGSGCHNNPVGTSIDRGNLNTYTYTDLSGGSLSLPPGNVYVNTTVATSGLYCWPKQSCGSGSHNGGTLSDTAVASIRRWLESGAHNDP